METKTIRETSKPVINRLLKLADVQPKHRVLEPSAGYGAIADVIKSMGAQVDCVELNGERRQRLISNGHSVVGGDFMLFNPAEKYERIVAAPNFRDNVDCAHIMRMFDVCLANGGMMASLTSPYWMTGEN